VTPGGCGRRAGDSRVRHHDKPGIRTAPIARRETPAANDCLAATGRQQEGIGHRPRHRSQRRYPAGGLRWRPGELRRRRRPNRQPRQHCWPVLVSRRGSGKGIAWAAKPPPWRRGLASWEFGVQGGPRAGWAVDPQAPAEGFYPRRESGQPGSTVGVGAPPRPSSSTKTRSTGSPVSVSSALSWTCTVEAWACLAVLVSASATR
jgi:hypothetical protein